MIWSGISGVQHQQKMKIAILLLTVATLLYTAAPASYNLKALIQGLLDVAKVQTTPQDIWNRDKEYFTEHHIPFNPKTVRFVIPAALSGIDYIIIKDIGKECGVRYVWLDEGNANGGLKHIVDDHGDTFRKYEGIKGKDEIAHYIKTVLTTGFKHSTHDSFKISYKDFKPRIIGSYKVAVKKYLIVLFGLDGYIF